MTGKKKGPVNPKPKVNTYADIKKRQKEKKAQTSVPSKRVQDEPEQKQVVSEHDQRHQQRVLDVFRRAFDNVLTSPNLTATLQSVKQALYDRDFAKAFGDQEHLAVYAARWSPTRALCYASVLGGIKEHLELLPAPTSPTDTTPGDGDKDGDETETTADDLPEPQQLKILSIGGCTAELAAFGAFINQHPSLSASMTLLDSGPWETAIANLTAALTTPPPVSKYASEAVKLASKDPLVPASYFTPTFTQQDALTLDKTQFTSLLGTKPLLITILFTLNELFTASGIGKTTAFLLNLTAAVPPGSLLLVVDSPGSYSETSVGKEAKRYPMQWLLDRIMLGTQREPVEGRRWAKVESQDSVWFRLASDALEYPIPLENMRYQMHLYRAEDASLVRDD
jgi:25S rRNA (uracil2843-N3)-methyltransferase